MHVQFPDELSPQQPGLVANGTTYDYRAIRADFTRHPADHDSLTLPDPRGIGEDDCSAERGTLTGGYQGNTLFRK